MLETTIYRDFVNALLPFALLAVNVTVYCPDSLYVCTGFFSLEPLPSPKVHLHAAGAPVLWSVKLTVRGAFPEVGDAENLERGASETPETKIYPVFVSALLPFALLAVNVTLYFPALLYVCTGFFSVELPPSPKVHFHAVGAPVLWSLKLTVRGTLPIAGVAEKAVTGTASTVFCGTILFSEVTLMYLDI